MAFTNLILLHTELKLEDILLLTKCDRYRKVSGASICPTLYEAKAII